MIHLGKLFQPHWRQATTVDGQIDFHGKGKARHFGEMWEQFQHFCWTPKEKPKPQRGCWRCMYLSRGWFFFKALNFFLVDFFLELRKVDVFVFQICKQCIFVEVMFNMWNVHCKPCWRIRNLMLAGSNKWKDKSAQDASDDSKIWSNYCDVTQPGKGNPGLFQGSQRLMKYYDLARKMGPLIA